MSAGIVAACTPETVEEFFPRFEYFFGRELHRFAVLRWVDPFLLGGTPAQVLDEKSFLKTIPLQMY